MRWPFSASQIVSKVAIYHAGPGSAGCSLKLIAAITKAHPLLIHFTAYILFKPSCNLFIFHASLLLLEHLLFCFMDTMFPLILNAFIRSGPLTHNHVEWDHFNGSLPTNRDTLCSVFYFSQEAIFIDVTHFPKKHTNFYMGSHKLHRGCSQDVYRLWTYMHAELCGKGVKQGCRIKQLVGLLSGSHNVRDVKPEGGEGAWGLCFYLCMHGFSPPSNQKQDC